MNVTYDNSIATSWAANTENWLLFEKKKKSEEIQGYAGIEHRKWMQKWHFAGNKNCKKTHAIDIYLNGLKNADNSCNPSKDPCMVVKGAEATKSLYPFSEHTVPYPHILNELERTQVDHQEIW